MDTTVRSIRFDEDGECNYCKIHDLLEKRYVQDPDGDDLRNVVAAVRSAGEGKKYDVICGTSGGRDSTWTLYVAAKLLGLRVLAVHFDNGWNSAIATRNIYNACSALDIDLETYVVDWAEFRDIQKSFLKASVPDVEVPTDVAIHAVMHRFAQQEGIKYIFNGHSFRTEGVAPLEWTYMDGRYIGSVQKIFGSTSIKSFPNFKMTDFIKHNFLLKTRVVPILNYFPYIQDEVESTIKTELGWANYGGHHHESFYTKFIQSYLLPRKFKVDRRKTEYSALIRSGQISRERALEVVNSEYPYDEDLLDYTKQKLGLSDADWDGILKSPIKSFRDYPTYYPFLSTFRIPVLIASRLGLIDDLLYLKFFG